MQKKKDKVGNETVYKEGRQRKKMQRARLRKIEIDILKKVPILVRALLRKNMFNYINSFSRKYALCVANLIVTHSYDSQKSVQEGKW